MEHVAKPARLNGPAETKRIIRNRARASRASSAQPRALVLQRRECAQCSPAAHGPGARPHWAGPEDLPEPPLLASVFTAPRKSAESQDCRARQRAATACWKLVEKKGYNMSLHRQDVALVFPWDSWKQSVISRTLSFSGAGVKQKLRVARVFKKWAKWQVFCDFPVMTSAQFHLFLLHQKNSWSHCATFKSLLLVRLHAARLKILTKTKNQVSLQWVRELGAPFIMDDAHPPHCEGLSMMAGGGRRAGPPRPLSIKAAVQLSTLSRAHPEIFETALCTRFGAVALQRFCV